MTWTLVQSQAAQNSASGTSLSVTFAAAVTAGNTIILSAAWADTSTPSFSDDKSNAYTVLENVDETTGQESAAFAVLTNVTNGPITFTLTNSPATLFRHIIAEEWSCTGGPSPGTDGHHAAVFASVADGAAFDSGNIVTTVDGDLIWGMSVCTSSGVFATVGSGFTQATQNGGGSQTTEDKTQNSAGSVAATWTNTTGNGAQGFTAHILAVKPFVTGGVPLSIAAVERPPLVSRKPPFGLTLPPATLPRAWVSVEQATQIPLPPVRPLVGRRPPFGLNQPPPAIPRDSTSVEQQPLTAMAVPPLPLHTKRPPFGLALRLGQDTQNIIAAVWSSSGISDAPWIGTQFDASTTQRTLPIVKYPPLVSRVPPFGLALPPPQIPGAAAGISSATWTSAGAANDAIWTGASIAAATWSSAGLGDAQWIGTGIFGTTWSASATGDAAWSGASTFAATWSASGLGSANWTGASTAEATWTSTGSGDAQWTGAATAAGIWGAAGLSDAPWVGSVASTQGDISAVGVGAALWIGEDATPAPSVAVGTVLQAHRFTRKRWRELKEELEAARAALIAKAEKSKPEQRKALVKAAAATETVIGILPFLPEESIVEPVINNLVRAADAAAAARTRAAVVAQTTAALRYAELIIEEAEEEEAEMLLFFH